MSNTGNPRWMVSEVRGKLGEGGGIEAISSKCFKEGEMDLVKCSQQVAEWVLRTEGWV